jgi:putative FmdB family regulatory protein
MPLYEFRCPACDGITTLRCAIAARPETVVCEHCGEANAARILSRSSVHRSSASKAARLDPKYDRMVDQAMRNTSEADPDRILKRLKPFPKDDTP